MHIAYFSPSWPPDGAANGITTYVRVMADAMRILGHRVTIITGRCSFADDGQIVEAPPKSADRLLRMASRHLDHRFGHFPFAGRLLARRVAGLHRRDPFDVVEMEETFGMVGAIARAEPPVIARLHGPTVQSAAWLAGSRSRAIVQREKAERAALARVAAISAPALPTLRLVADAYGLNSEQRVIPNPVEIPPAPWRPPDGPKRLLWVGKISFAKGIDRLLEAFALLAAGDDDIWLDVVGPQGEAGPDGQILKMDELLSAMLQSARRICYHGLATAEQIAELRSAATLSVITSRSEVFPYAFFEPAAAGHPVVAMQWPGADEIIRNNLTGVLTSTRPAALAAAIRTIIGDNERLASIGAAARRHVELTLSPAVVAGDMAAFYAEVAQEFGSRVRN